METEPLPPAAENATNENNLNGGPAGDDSSSGTSSKEISNAVANNEMETQNETYISSNTNALRTPVEKPGKRTYNPLGNFSSYTYQLTWYMVTPDAYRAFVESGRTNINALTSNMSNQAVQQSRSGAYIIAQSGGISSPTQRLPGMNLDVYIGDLEITTTAAPSETGSASNVTNVKFNIIEPYGFSFISNLVRASESLKNASSLPNYQQQFTNAIRQYFVIGIRFLGYDAQGNLMTESETLNAQQIVEGGNSVGMFETFYDITLESMKFKLDGKAVTYNITARTISPGEAFGGKRARINDGVRIQGRTVSDAIDGPNGLLTKLNEDQKSLSQTTGVDGKPGIKVPNEYKVRFVGDADAIKNAGLVTSIDKLDKSNWPTSPILNIGQSNDKTSVTSTPDNSSRMISFGASITVMQAINAIISQSTYMSDALKTMYKAELQTDPKKKAPEQIPDKNPDTIRWYNLSSEVLVKDWDPVVGDFAYEITYVIQPYEIPFIASPYASKTTKYYGPHKRYDYWFTGKNSEVTSYEIKYDNLWFNTSIIPSGSDNSHLLGMAVPTVPWARQNEDRTGQYGLGREAPNSVITSLYDPDSYAKAKINILGDPDFLIQDSPSTVNSVYRQFYGNNGFTINANGGQVFIEIDFKEGVDYDNTYGVMKINESIKFFNYSSDFANQIKGVCHQVKTVTSTFRNGTFLQSLNCVLPTFAQPGGSGLADRPVTGTTSTDTRVPSNQGGGEGGNTDTTQGGGGGTGFPADNPPPSSSNSSGANQPPPNVTNQPGSPITTQTSNTPVLNDKGVATDDANGGTGGTQNNNPTDEGGRE